MKTYENESRQNGPRRDGRRRLRRMVAVAGVGILLVSAAGCAPTATPSRARTPTATASTAAPVFATDEDALLAAQTAFRGYIETADQIITEGGVNPERVETYVTGVLAEEEFEFYEGLRQKGTHGTGTSTFSNMSLHELTPDADAGEGVVVVTVCSDITGTDIVDSSGQTVIGVIPNPRTPMLVTFDLADPGAATLKAADTERWEGEGVCE